MNTITQIFLFVTVLAVLKFVFGLPISILGSLGLTILLTLVFSAFSRSHQ